MVRFDGPLFFANASYLEDQIRNRRQSKKGLKHIIISGGENISPKEIEIVINQLEDVVESSVVGIPD